MNKLIIQIPCFCEAETLPIALAEIPRKVEGFDLVELLVIDDGSDDNTAEVAKACGVDHIVRHSRNRGLASAFKTGITTALKLGADVIVNTDADNQYNPNDIQKIVTPVLEGKADMVVGARPIKDTDHFSWSKKLFQKLGSWVVRAVSGTDIKDAPSGFRAISRKAAKKINVFSSFTYTLETIIQAGYSELTVMSVPIRVNEDLRPSRLFKSNFQYITRSAITILRVLMVYKPLRFFGYPAALFFLMGISINFRFLYYYLTGHGSGHIQSIMLGSLLIGGALILLVTGLITDLISVNRKLLEKIDFHSSFVTSENE